MKTLTKELNRQWIKALRSGKYKQGRNNLHSHNTYCCLGVLQDTADVECTNTDFLQGENGRSCVKGLTSEKQMRLAEMNDSGKNFQEIADWIEKYINPKR